MMIESKYLYSAQTFNFKCNIPNSSSKEFIQKKIQHLLKTFCIFEGSWTETKCIG